MPPELLAVLVALITSGVLTGIIDWARRHKTDEVTVVDVMASASVKTVDSLMKAVEHLEGELEKTRRDLCATRVEVEKLRTENQVLSQKVARLTAELEAARA